MTKQKRLTVNTTSIVGIHVSLLRIRGGMYSDQITVAYDVIKRVNMEMLIKNTKKIIYLTQVTTFDTSLESPSAIL